MIYSFIYLFTTAISMILVQKIDSTIPPFFSLLITSTIAIFYFNLINLNNLKTMYLACWQRKKLWLGIMVSVLIMWSCSMVAPGIIGASLHGFLYFSWLGMLGFLSLSWQDWKKNRRKFYCAVCLAILIMANIGFELKLSFSARILFGMMLSLIGATSCFVYFKQSQAVIKTMLLSTTQILAVRFYLTSFFLFIILPKSSFSHYLTLNNTLSLIILAFITLIIPLYFSQKALEKITAEQNAIIMSLCPVVTGLIQEFIFGGVTLEQKIIYGLYSATIGGFYFLEKCKNKKEAVV